MFLSGHELPEIQRQLDVAPSTLRKWCSDGRWRDLRQQGTPPELYKPSDKLLDERGALLLREVNKRLGSVLTITEILDFQNNMLKGLMSECGALITEIRAHRQSGGSAFDTQKSLQLATSVAKDVIHCSRLLLGQATQRVELDLSGIHPDLLEGLVSIDEDEPVTLDLPSS
jgi:hypothetical protein